MSEGMRKSAKVPFDESARVVEVRKEEEGGRVCVLSMFSSIFDQTRIRGKSTDVGLDRKGDSGGDRKWRCMVSTIQGDEREARRKVHVGGWYGFRQHLVQSVSLVRRAKHRSDSK